jgi:hypothetical protein
MPGIVVHIHHVRWQGKVYIQIILLRQMACEECINYKNNGQEII